MQQVNWGIIGCGNVTEKKSGPAFNKVDGSKLVAVMRRNGEKARDYARRHGVPRWYDDADALINDTEVNAVYIATPPDSHADYALRVAAAGKPVYVEKPMARTHAECQKMQAACEKAGVPLFVAYYRRRLPCFLKVKELLETGAIGEVRLVCVHLHYPPRKEDFDRDHLPWRVRPEISGGGYFVDLASHQLDFLDFFFGPVETVSGTADNQAGLYPAEDAVSAHFRFASGVIGVGSWCFSVAQASRMDRVQIFGSEGSLTFSSFDHRVPITLTTARGDEEIPFSTPEHIQQPLIQTIVDELLGRGQCPSTGESAARTNWVMDQVLAEWRSRVNQ